MIHNAAMLGRSLRVGQWTKNLVIFAALLFSRNALDPALLARTAAACLIFCLLSGAVYLLNDLTDLAHDRRHPLKRRRPLASGALRPSVARIALLLLAAVALAAAWALDPGFFLVCALYLALQAAYSFLLKHIVILDVFVIAAGFVLRVLAGGFVINVPLSSWLIVCTMLLSLFLALCKRRHEIVLIGSDADTHRRVLAEYTPYLLDQMIAVVTASTVMAYALYTISADTVQKFGTRALVFTIPFVLYGILRYLYLVHQKGRGGRPENILLTDTALLLDILLWIATAALILYL